MERKPGCGSRHPHPFFHPPPYQCDAANPEDDRTSPPPPTSLLVHLPHPLNSTPPPAASNTPATPMDTSSGSPSTTLSFFT